jgi:hypothetical protein
LVFEIIIKFLLTLFHPSLQSIWAEALKSLLLQYFHQYEYARAPLVKQATKFIRRILLEEPLHIRIDGSTGEGVILKPQPKLTEVMDERESTGI